MVILAVVVHIVIMLAGRHGPDTARHRAWLVYGIPVCWAAAAILTPPDPLTMLAVAVPCSLLYGVPVLIWGLR
jgi:Sec-independent protein secretion pathway component TatC